MKKIKEVLKMQMNLMQIEFEGEDCHALYFCACDRNHVSIDIKVVHATEDCPREVNFRQSGLEDWHIFGDLIEETPEKEFSLQ